MVAVTFAFSSCKWHAVDSVLGAGSGVCAADASDAWSEAGSRDGEDSGL